MRVTNGFGAKTEIAYAPLTLKDAYRPDTNSRNAQSNWGRGSPVQDVLGPMYVAHRVSSTSAQNGDPAAQSTVRYRYNGAKLQAGGRGFLGFREVVTIDPKACARICARCTPWTITAIVSPAPCAASR